jgi:hypothetical protein
LIFTPILFPSQQAQPTITKNKMKNFTSFANFSISTTEMMNIEGGTQVFGDDTVTLGAAPILVDETVPGAKPLNVVQTIGGRPLNPTPTQRGGIAPKVKSVTYTGLFGKGCFGRKH